MFGVGLDQTDETAKNGSKLRPPQFLLRNCLAYLLKSVGTDEGKAASGHGKVCGLVESDIARLADVRFYASLLSNNLASDVK